MQGSQATYLGLRELPRELSEFELKAFFTFDRSERKIIDARRGHAHKLGLALHTTGCGFPLGCLIYR
jgi:hypothetical protein